MTDDKESKVLDAARKSLDQSVDDISDDLSATLAAARQRAINAGPSTEANNTETTNDESKIVQLRPSWNRNRIVWGGAIAASCAALSLTLVLRQPGADEFLPLDAADSFALGDTQESIFLIAEMDETEWDLVQELEFALWLSEFGDEATAADFSG